MFHSAYVGSIITVPPTTYYSNTFTGVYDLLKPLLVLVHDHLQLKEKL